MLTIQQQQTALKVAEGRERDPAIAAAAGVSVRTFYRWKKLPEFAAEVQRLCEDFGQALEAAAHREHEKELEAMFDRSVEAIRSRPMFDAEVRHRR